MALVLLRPAGQTGGADRAAGRRIRCPTLVLWSTRDDLQELYGNVPSVWEPWAEDLRGAAVDSGHRMAEEAPQELAAHLVEFLAAARTR